MIRQITADEIWLTRDCAHEFFSESELPGLLDFDYWLGRWKALIEELDMGAIFVYEVGGIVKGLLGGIYCRCSMTGDYEAIEAFWYVKIDSRGTPAGIKLLKAFENWARKRGAKRVKMMHLSNLNADTMCGIYHRMGYSPLEVAFSKEL